MVHKYRIRFQPLEFDLYAFTENDAMDLAYFYVDLGSYELHLEEIATVDHLDDDSFYPVNEKCDYQ